MQPAEISSGKQFNTISNHSEPVIKIRKNTPQNVAERIVEQSKYEAIAEKEIEQFNYEGEADIKAVVDITPS